MQNWDFQVALSASAKVRAEDGRVVSAHAYADPIVAIDEAFSDFFDVNIELIDSVHISESYGNLSAVPVPAAAWLFGSVLLGFFGWTHRKNKKG